MAIDFSFKTVTTKDAQGNEVQTKRETVSLKLPLLDLEQIIILINQGDAKVNDLIVESINAVIIDNARETLKQNAAMTAATFPMDKADFISIAYTEPEARKTRGIPQEAFDTFADAYIKNAGAYLGKDQGKVEKAGSAFKVKLAPYKNAEKILLILQKDLLSVVEAPWAAEHAAVLDYLLNKAEEFLGKDRASDFE